MFTLKLPSVEIYDEEKNLFTTSKEKIVVLEHSLVSISKWESKWHRPFLSKAEKSLEESMDYIRCMIVTPNITADDIFPILTTQNVTDIQEYIASKQTATTINTKNKPSNEIITSEIIYYWMVAHNIPFECQKWHLNRLLMLISVCNEKNAPQKKMSKKDVASKYRSLNEQRRKAHKTKG
jgi:hypothetical protein